MVNGVLMVVGRRVWSSVIKCGRFLVAGWLYYLGGHKTGSLGWQRG